MKGLILLFCLFLPPVEEYAPLDRMPILKNDKYIASFSEEPEAKRDEKYIYYLQASVKIRKSAGGNSHYVGSGTICYYDGEYAYIISCGHLFNGNRLPPTNETCEVIVYYKNDKKLPEPQTFKAEVICHSSAEDISFLKFKPDWQIRNYFVIAPKDYKLEDGKVYESTGCDNASSPASYTVTIEKREGRNLLTVNNAPRQGRSGGGLLSADGHYLGIVWGSTGVEGYYVPPDRINEYASQFPETRFLLNLSNFSSILNNLKIYDKNGNEKHITIPFP